MRFDKGVSVARLSAVDDFRKAVAMHMPRDAGAGRADAEAASHVPRGEGRPPIAAQKRRQPRADLGSGPEQDHARRAGLVRVLGREALHVCPAHSGVRV